MPRSNFLPGLKIIASRLFDVACFVSVVALTVFALSPVQFDAISEIASRFGIDNCYLMEALLLIAIGYSLLAGRRIRFQKDLITHGQAVEKQALDLAFLDALTEMPNRRQLDATLREITAVVPADTTHALLMIDLNGFKRINDVYGHPTGDEALVRAAARIRNAVREGDFVARLGGDEFAVVARELAGPQDAAALGARIIEGLRHPVTAGGVEHQMGAGVGIALFPEDAADPASLIRRADVALYRAKKRDRSAVCLFDPAMEFEALEREKLEQDLRSAIGSAALRPFYQPIYDLQSGRITGFEALARWRHPTLGELEPARFIPIANETGMIREVTDDLLAQACREAASWPSDICLSFNISAAQLNDETLGLRVMRILLQSGLSPHRLEIEVSENSLASENEGARQFLGALQSAGIKIALDNYGSGKSDIFALRDMSLNKVKIDRSCLLQMIADSDTTAVVKSVVDLGERLKFAVTADGVEDEEQQALLRGQGFREAQGFLFSKAVPAAEAGRLAQQNRDTGRRPVRQPSIRSSAA